MSDLALKRAVAQCAGWEFHKDVNVTNYTPGISVAIDHEYLVRLRSDANLSFDDVWKACEELNVDHITISQAPRRFEGKWYAYVEFDEMGAGENMVKCDTAAEALAYALCDACGVEVGE